MRLVPVVKLKDRDEDFYTYTLKLITTTKLKLIKEIKGSSKW